MNDRDSTISDARSLAEAILDVAKHLTASASGESKQRMQKVVERKQAGFYSTFGRDPSDSHTVSKDHAIRLCVDLAFCSPFAPYDLRYSEKDFESAVTSVSARWSITPELASAIFKDKRQALSAYRHIDARKIVLMGAAGMAIVAATGFAAAPLIGGALGGVAGLSGAAATSYGLAMLGGGSLAAGGAGMSGGLWLVTGIGAATGALGGSGAALVRALGASELKIELAKLLVTFRQIDSAKLTHIAKAQEVIQKLEEQLESLNATLVEERQLNDANSQRIKDIEEKIWAVRHTTQAISRAVPRTEALESRKIQVLNK